MRWYEWIIVVLVVVMVNLGGLLYVKRQVFRIKTVDLVKLVDIPKAEMLEGYVNGELTDAELEERYRTMIERIEAELAREPGIVMVRQAVAGGEHEDITEKIRARLGD